ncbi:glutathione peroxidase-family protein [Brevibacillus fulvus]|uniref:Glutathione peroxidase-family protein n=1 Tax=Brevibacillus fulvus TaxID=1125967 RepID=A0A938XVK6_9BACL|nr:glutathione peroxidase-family protein [Brevibacillus fulvus]
MFLFVDVRDIIKEVEPKYSGWQILWNFTKYLIQY